MYPTIDMTASDTVKVVLLLSQFSEDPDYSQNTFFRSYPGQNCAMVLNASNFCVKDREVYEEALITNCFSSELSM